MSNPKGINQYTKTGGVSTKQRQRSRMGGGLRTTLGGTVHTQIAAGHGQAAMARTVGRIIGVGKGPNPLVKVRIKDHLGRKTNFLTRASNLKK